MGMNVNDKNVVMSFAESEGLLHSPFIDIYGSLFAVITTHYSNRRMRPGDLYDVPILATVLPYCDVVTADAFMKEILVQVLRFDDKYKAEILSATHEDRLAFQELVKGLVHATQ
jgi:hypothetical protein